MHNITVYYKQCNRAIRSLINLSSRLGGPFDLMSRRIIAANSQVLAERIAKELQIIPLQRDDATN